VRVRPTAVAALALAVLLVACGGRPVSQEELAAQLGATRVPAEARAGDLLLRASIAPTASLGEAIAAHYGVSRNPRTVLLLVGVRRTDGATETSLPAVMEAGVRDLRGVRRPVELREVRSEGFIDYVGEVPVTPPDTLSFDIQADAGDAGIARLAFSREVFRP
jgi:hypothetical protein